MVLDGVVRPAGDELGDLGPLVAPLLVRVVDDSVLLVGPGRLLDLRVEVVVPTFSALLSNAALQLLGCNKDYRLLSVHFPFVLIVF